MAKSAGAKLATTLKYTFETRLKFNALDPNRGFARRPYGAAKLYAAERKRRKFLKARDGMQANGYPAYESCLDYDPETELFLANLMMPDSFATEAEMAARRDRVTAARIDGLRACYCPIREPHVASTF